MFPQKILILRTIVPSYRVLPELDLFFQRYDKFQYLERLQRSHFDSTVNRAEALAFLDCNDGVLHVQVKSNLLLSTESTLVVVR